MIKKSTTSLLILSFIAAGGSVGYGSILMFDFGATVPTGGDEINTPAHAAGAATAGDSTWNIISDVGTSGTSNAYTSLSYADGSAATGISFAFGSSTVGSKIINFDSPGSGFKTIPGSLDAGVFSGTNPSRDVFFPDTNADISVGAVTSGLAAGTYSVFITGNNTNAFRDMNMFASAVSSTSSYDFSGDTGMFVDNTGLHSDWIVGETYAVFNVTISTGQSIAVAVDGDPSSDTRGFIGSVQIAPAVIPEPSSAGVIFAFFAAAYCIRRRK
jgi:hypothetical protein